MSGIFTRFNQTRRVGIARLFSDGTVDTSFMDTAYNQFAGRASTTIGTRASNRITSFPPWGCNPTATSSIAGNFPRIGGGTARDAIRNKQNFTRLIGGATPGPGNIGLVYQNYSANQTDENPVHQHDPDERPSRAGGRHRHPVTYPTNNGDGRHRYRGPGLQFRFCHLWHSHLAYHLSRYYLAPG